jgi:integrase
MAGFHRQISLGPIWQEQDLAFPDETGKPLSNFRLYRQFLSLVKRADVPLIRFHDLRHTAATLLLLQGINVEVVSEMLGHSSIAITLDLYGHVVTVQAEP